MKVKICGITDPEDASMCEDLGADALGFVHVEGRGRSRSLDEISEMCSSVGPMTTTVIVSMPGTVADAERIFAASGADMIQLHSLGPDDIDLLRCEGVPVIRAVRPDIAEAMMFADHADALLFEDGAPGTGSGYDYSRVPVDAHRRCIIAGGLNIRNVDTALSMAPYALDVSSGVEREAGRKDQELVREFISRCRR